MAIRNAVEFLGGGGDVPEGFWYSVKRRLLGPPMVNEELRNQRLSKPLALGVLSPDGHSVVYSGMAQSGNGRAYYIRRLDQLTARPENRAAEAGQANSGKGEEQREPACIWLVQFCLLHGFS